MSTLLYTLGQWCFRRPWRVLGAWLLALALAGGGALALGTGTDNTFSIPGTESQKGLEQLDRTFPEVSGASAQAIVVARDGDRVTDAAYADEIDATITRLEGLEGVAAVTNPRDVEGMVSDEGAALIVRMQFDGQATAVPPRTIDGVTDAFHALQDALPEGSEVRLGGDLFAMSIPGVTITEAVGLLIALLVLIVTFRSFVVAGLPLLTAVLGVGGSMALIFLATAFAPVSSTTPLLALMLGLAVGIDYALFIVSRHQDQVRAGVVPEESAARATGTAGSAVVFAGVTVVIALVGLAFAGIPFLTTMGIAASVAVAIAVAVAVTLTPALLGFAGSRVRGWATREPRSKRARARRARRAAVPAESRGWSGLVTRHPWSASAAVVVLLGLLAIPASSLALALPNAGMLPSSSEARQNYDLTAEHFGAGFNGPLIVTGTIVTSTDPLGLMDDLAREIEKIPGVEAVPLATPNRTADTGIVQIVPATAPDAPETAELVRALRAEHDRFLDEYGIDTQVTGFTAVAIDISDRLSRALLPFGIFVVGLSVVLLALVFRSIWVPVTAALGYLFSVAAAFGIVAAAFEWGWGADLLHVTRVGPVISFMPIVLMGVLFGLAMDYHVFLVSRMRENYVHAVRDGAESREAAVRAVRTGFRSSSRVVTAAALIMFAVFVAFVPEGDASLKPIALGLAAGIAIDAFLVRMTLIPAVMTLLAERAWWLPSWLERRLPVLDIEGEAVERERQLRAWPEDGAYLAADDARIAGAVGVLDLRAAAGSTVVLAGLEARAYALALGGRVPFSQGRVRVDGHLLPGRERWVRAHVGVIELGEASAERAPLRPAEFRNAARAPIVVLTGIDAAARGAAGADQVAALLRDLPEDASLVVATTDPERACALLRAADRSPHVLSLTETPTEAHA